MHPWVQLLRYEDVRTKSSNHFEGNLREKTGGRERICWGSELGFKVNCKSIKALDVKFYNV